MQVAIIGTGYVGLVTGTCLSEVGHNVTCIDLDSEKIKKLKDAISPIYEPGLSQLIMRNIQHGRLDFSTSLADSLGGATMAFIAVGTPEGEDGSADLSYVKGVAEEIGKLMDSDLTVVVKSTVPVGTCDIVEEIIQNQLKKRGENFAVTVASNPEFLKEGAAVEDFMRPNRIIVGLKNNSGQDQFTELYSPFIQDDPSKLVIMDRRSSELSKYASNAMLATRISFMNELSHLVEKVGANIDSIRRGMGMDDRIGKKFLYAGPGYGGSCFPKDVSALIKSARNHSVDLSVLESVTVANDKQKRNMSQKVMDHFKSDLIGKTIAVWGLAFKPETDDVREAPALTIIQDLLNAGAKVVAHDPEANESFARSIGEQDGLSYSKESYEALKSADALVLVTEWAEYKRPNWDKVSDLMRDKCIFDFRNQYRFETLKSKGFTYYCVGRPDESRPSLN